MISKLCLDCGIFESFYAILATIYISSFPEDVSTSLNMTIGWDTHTRTDTYSERSYARYVQLKRRNTSRKAARI